MKAKRIISLLLACVTALSVTACGKNTANEPEISGMRDISTMEVVREMGFGINLGNCLESCGDWINSNSVSRYETAWGSPVITQTTIQGYANAGFGVLRVPVAWSNMMSQDGTYTISADYTARVKEIVGWALDTGMYVIINLHYDSGWLGEYPEHREEYLNRYTVMWQQISENFRDYDDKLIFESQNEELGWNSVWNQWSGTDGEEKQLSYDMVYEINQAFVDTVRASGGNNSLRHLLISGYNTDVVLTCDEKFRMPDDPANRMAVSVHYYTPSTLCILEKDADWGKAKTTWGSEADIAELEKNVELLKTTFIDNGIPVIVGEYGCFGKNKDREVKTAWMKDVAHRMYAIGACPVLWDTKGDEMERYSGTFRDPEFIAELIAPAKDGASAPDAA
ncbi:MAG: glycoside hydrolase family 5 protein [Oscillospiraceae bacterium]